VAAMRHVVGVAPPKDQQKGKAKVPALKPRFVMILAYTRVHAPRRRDALASSTKHIVQGTAIAISIAQGAGRGVTAERKTAFTVTVSVASLTGSAILSCILEVKTSKYDLGVFLKEAAEEGDLITEYIGELISEPTFDARGQLSKHRGRSYVYGLDALLNIDSTYAGNEARFINHAPKKTANCQARIFLVNGDRRIGIYA
ncbi:predicted protein, partial [Postia placenta Mad-698-R]